MPYERKFDVKIKLPLEQFLTERNIPFQIKPEEHTSQGSVIPGSVILPTGNADLSVASDDEKVRSEIEKFIRDLEVEHGLN
jgi:hypothetical protein